MVDAMENLRKKCAERTVYYLKYQQKRAEYVENFFHIINWNEVEKNME